MNHPTTALLCPAFTQISLPPWARLPGVELGRLTKNLPGRIFAKLEMRNPCGSVKDRLGVALIEDAEARGVLKPGMTIVEATGGNTGVGLAFVSAIRGYGLILTCRKPCRWKESRC